jgi:hypothetical protein
MILSLISYGLSRGEQMAKASGQSYKQIRTGPPRQQPSRAILHGFGTPVTKTLPNAQGAMKSADRLRTSPKRTSPARGKMPGQMVY